MDIFNKYYVYCLIINKKNTYLVWPDGQYVIKYKLFTIIYESKFKLLSQYPTTFLLSIINKISRSLHLRVSGRVSNLRVSQLCKAYCDLRGFEGNLT